MDRRLIATSSLAPALALAAAAAPAEAATGLREGTRPTGVITKKQWEKQHGGGITPDLCAHECGGSWGAYSHAVQDGFNHGYSQVASPLCVDIHESAGRGQAQWYCNAKGWDGKWNKYELDLSPYGYSLNGYYPK